MERSTSLATLPTELIQRIAHHLSTSEVANLCLVSRSLAAKPIYVLYDRLELGTVDHCDLQSLVIYNNIWNTPDDRVVTTDALVRGSQQATQLLLRTLALNAPLGEITKELELLISIETITGQVTSAHVVSLILTLPQLKRLRLDIVPTNQSIPAVVGQIPLGSLGKSDLVRMTRRFSTLHQDSQGDRSSSLSLRSCRIRYIADQVANIWSAPPLRIDNLNGLFYSRGLQHLELEGVIDDNLHPSHRRGAFALALSSVETLKVKLHCPEYPASTLQKLVSGAQKLTDVHIEIVCPQKGFGDRRVFESMNGSHEVRRALHLPTLLESHKKSLATLYFSACLIDAFEDIYDNHLFDYSRSIICQLRGYEMLQRVSLPLWTLHHCSGTCMQSLLPINLKAISILIDGRTVNQLLMDTCLMQDLAELVSARPQLLGRLTHTQVPHEAVEHVSFKDILRAFDIWRGASFLEEMRAHMVLEGAEHSPEMMEFLAGH